MVVTTAQVLFHRFYVYQSFKQHERFITAVASLFLAAKVEESMFKYKHLQTVVKAYLMLRRKYFNTQVLTEVVKIYNIYYSFIYKFFNLNIYFNFYRKLKTLKIKFLFLKEFYFKRYVLMCKLCILTTMQ